MDFNLHYTNLQNPTIQIGLLPQLSFADRLPQPKPDGYRHLHYQCSPVSIQRTEPDCQTTGHRHPSHILLGIDGQKGTKGLRT